jgi:hypothetical protein
MNGTRCVNHGHAGWPLSRRAREPKEFRMPTATDDVAVEDATCAVCRSVGEGCDATTCRGLDTD